MGSLSHSSGEDVMATGAVVNQGKTPFVEKYFASHPDGNLETVNEAWTAAGNAGTLSESLVGKVRSRLGLTGKKKVDEPKPIETPAEPKKAAKAKAPAKPRKVAKTAGQAPPVSNGSQVPAAAIATTHHDHDEDVLDELEDGIDELIQKIKGLGGKLEVVKALKRARRLLVRSHGG
jgi:hypothetical protein